LLRILIAFLLLILPAYGQQPLSKEQLDSLNKTVESFSSQVKEFEKQLKEAEKKVDRKRLKQMYDYVHSEEFQNRVNDYSRQIIEWTGKLGNKNAEKDLRLFNSQVNANRTEQETWAMVVFLSSSMGNDLDSYLDDMSLLIDKQVEKFGKLYLVPYGAIRGLVALEKNQKPTLTTTVLWLKKELAGRNVQILIDPILFRQYGVDRVPCILLTKFSALEQRECSESYLGCGYSVFGFLSKVEERTDNKGLKELLRELEE